MICLSQLPVLRLGLLQDRDLGVSVFPECKEIPIRNFRSGSLALALDAIGVVGSRSLEGSLRSSRDSVSLRKAHCPHQVLEVLVRAQIVQPRIHLKIRQQGRPLLSRFVKRFKGVFLLTQSGIDDCKLVRR